MISKNQIKLITSLQQKKFRQKYKLFIAEGAKVIQELLQSNFELEHLYCTEPLFESLESKKNTIISVDQLKKISCLSTPNNCLALFKIPDKGKNIENKGIILVLDNINDPGNLGTIIRLCDWFGVEKIVCSLQTVDVFNPKVVQSTMGSISRVSITYQDIQQYLTSTNLPIFGTFMDGENIYSQKLPQNAIIILGNEANGISENIEKLATHRVSIPRFGKQKMTESLNVAMATSIFLSEFKRNSIEM